MEWLFIIEEFVLCQQYRDCTSESAKMRNQSVDETLLIYDELQSSVSSETD